MSSSTMAVEGVLSRLIGGVLRACAVVGLLAIVGGAAWWSGRAGALPALLTVPGDERAAIQFLRREPLSFLVTERVVTQVVVEAQEGNLLLGYGNGFLGGKVELRYGVDLSQLDESAVRRRGDTLCVQVPPPELLRYVPDLSSLRFIEKKSALLVIVDKARGVNLYERCLARIEEAARTFARDNQLAPTRAQLVARLNDFAPAMSTALGTTVVFE